MLHADRGESLHLASSSNGCLQRKARKRDWKGYDELAENLARDRGYKALNMHARKNAVGFYEKMGYQVASEEFTEVTIPHVVMEKKL